MKKKIPYFIFKIPEKNLESDCWSFSKDILVDCYRKKLTWFWVSTKRKHNRSYHPIHGEGCGAIDSKIFSLVPFAPTPERHNKTGGHPEQRRQINRQEED